ncbi:phage/plasmid replication protein [Pseudomonas sp. PCH446]
MEQELKQEYLIKHGLHFWGLFDESKFIPLHNKFLALDSRLQVTAMDHFTIAEKLLDDGIVTNMLSANSTAAYVYNWMAGHSFDFKKSQVKIARARLRRIGIDIANPSDSSRHPAMFVRRMEEVVTSDVHDVPAWYRKPSYLRLCMKTVSMQGLQLSANDRRNLAFRHQVKQSFMNSVLADQVADTLKAIEVRKEQGLKPERVWVFDYQERGTLCIANGWGINEYLVHSLYVLGSFNFCSLCLRPFFSD